MKRHLKFIVMFFLLPPAFAFASVFIQSFLGLDFETQVEWTRANSYVAGMVAGVWLWGAAA